MKSVRCMDCGFLYRDWHASEAASVEMQLMDRVHPEGAVNCLRSGPLSFEVSEDRETVSINYQRLIRRRRQCGYFSRHKTGYGPREHLALQEKVVERRDARIWGLVYVVAGGLIASIPLFLEKLFF